MSVFVPGSVGDDQDPPQCGRAAGEPSPAAGGAAEGAVQGRGARAGSGSGHRRGVRLAPPLPRAGAGHPSAGGDHPRASVGPARGGRHLVAGDQRRGHIQ